MDSEILKWGSIFTLIGGMRLLAYLLTSRRSARLETQVRNSLNELLTAHGVTIKATWDQSQGTNLVVSKDSHPPVNLHISLEDWNTVASQKLGMMKDLKCGNSQLDDAYCFFGRSSPALDEYMKAPEFLTVLTELLPVLSQAQGMLILNSSTPTPYKLAP